MLKRGLMTACRTGLLGCVALRLEDKFLCGLADILIVWKPLTVFLEAKYAKPNFDKKPIQELMMARLAKAGFARYVVWQEFHDGVKKTLIIHPAEVYGKGGKTSLMLAEVECDGFHHDFVVDYIRSRAR